MKTNKEKFVFFIFYLTLSLCLCTDAALPPRFFRIQHDKIIVRRRFVLKAAFLIFGLQLHLLCFCCSFAYFFFLFCLGLLVTVYLGYTLTKGLLSCQLVGRKAIVSSYKLSKFPPKNCSNNNSNNKVCI